MQFINEETGWLITENGGEVYRTVDGGNCWELKYRLKRNTELWQLHFVDENIGWAAGEYNTLIKTTDGGDSWFPQHVTTADFKLRSVYFRDADNGWVTGSSGRIFRTHNGGNNWIQEEQSVGVELLYIYFFDSQKGWVIGTHGKIIAVNYSEYLFPIELINFSAQIVNSRVKLFWQTKYERDNLGFVIQRKRKNTGWQKVDFVRSLGENHKINSYSYIDESAQSGLYYYRLKQISNRADEEILPEVKIMVE